MDPALFALVNEVRFDRAGGFRFFRRIVYRFVHKIFELVFNCFPFQTVCPHLWDQDGKRFTDLGPIGLFGYCHGSKGLELHCSLFFSEFYIHLIGKPGILGDVRSDHHVGDVPVTKHPGDALGVETAGYYDLDVFPFPRRLIDFRNIVIQSGIGCSALLVLGGGFENIRKEAVVTLNVHFVESIERFYISFQRPQAVSIDIFHPGKLKSFDILFVIAIILGRDFVREIVPEEAEKVQKERHFPFAFVLRKAAVKDADQGLFFLDQMDGIDPAAEL